jgi:Zn ribbon nucleic-acid-binding protein
MITFDCPWCAEPATLDAGEPDEVTCEACGLQAELAPEPVRDRLDRAA